MIKDLQNLPEDKKKIILWAIVVIVAIVIIFVQLYSVKEKIENIDFSSSPVVDVGNAMRSGIIGISERLNELSKDE